MENNNSHRLRWEIRRKQGVDPVKYKVRKMRLPPGTQRTNPIPDIFPIADPNIFILAKKQTGKTTVLYNLLKWMVKRNTIVIFFVNTLFQDPSYIRIVKMLKKRKIPYILETSFADEDGFDQVKLLVEYLKNRKSKEWEELCNLEPSADSSDEECNPYEDEDLESESTDEEEDKFEYIIVCDDISAEIVSSNSLKTLLKQNRHYKFTTLISTQDIADLPPGALAQMQYVLAFSQISEDPKNNRLEKLYYSLGLGIPYELFNRLYHIATDPEVEGTKSRSFLYIDTSQNLYRKNFTEELDIKKV